MSNPTELPDRVEALRDALKQISETRFGWDGDCGVTSIADEALSADDEAARRAQQAAAPEPIRLGIGISNNANGVHMVVIRKCADGITKVIVSSCIPEGDSYNHIVLLD